MRRDTAMKKINIFVSHKGNDEHYIERFKERIGSDFDVRDSSVVSTDPNNANNLDYIRNEYLKPGIDWAGKLVVLVGKDTKNSQHVDWEIDYAAKKGYPIIGIYLPGCDENDLPKSLGYLSTSITNWDDKAGIVDALKGAIVNNNSDGTPRVPSGGGGVIC
jgi:hypothetical protein